MQFAITFIEGLVSFISPCVLPMLPIYISYFGGDEAIRLDIASICSDISLDHSWRGCGMIKLSPIIMSIDDYRAEWRSSLLFHYIREEGVDIWL